MNSVANKALRRMSTKLQVRVIPLVSLSLQP